MENIEQLLSGVVDTGEGMWRLRVELDAPEGVVKVADRIDRNGWSDVLVVSAPHMRDPKVGPTSHARSVDTVQIDATVAAPDLDEAVWRLKALLRALGISPLEGFVALAANRVGPAR